MPTEFNYIHTPYDGHLSIVTWKDGTPAQIAAMLKAHDDGKINIYNYWSVGDERQIQLSAIAANPNGAFTTAMAAQKITMVLMNEGYTHGRSDGGTVHYIVGQKNNLNQTARYYSTDTNTMTPTSYYLFSDINSLYTGAFPSDELALYKSFYAAYDRYNTTPDPATYLARFHLFCEKEVFGSYTYSSQEEAAATAQIEYYKTSANRIKNNGTSSTAGIWWLRSRRASNTTSFCYVKADGTCNSTNASNSYRVAPFGCI